MSGDEETPYFGEYPKDFFDFIIIDECHRGGAKDESSWREILDYFSPAVQMGLTATPKRDINADTYDYFGKPVYTYSLKDGINDGFLTPFKVKEISTTIDDYTFTEDDEVIGGDVDTTREYTEKDFNKIIEIKAREEYRVKLFMNMINQSQKTLVFCATQIHAAAVRDLINQHKTSKSTKYCERVTADDGKIGEQHLRDFQDNEKRIPTILTTSQKLSTGVDAPEIRNIVLMRPVNSMIEFKQIVGRGTRLFDGKDYFTVYDFVEAHEHFKDPEWDGEPLDPAEPKPKGEGKNVTSEEEQDLTYETLSDENHACEDEERKIISIVLADGKKRELDSMVKTTFWDPNGTPISLDAFVKKLYGDMPSLFNNEEELRKIWSLPSTRKKLLQELNDLGYSAEQLEDLRKLVHGEDSDLFDVLNYIGYTNDLIPRLTRAQKAKIQFSDYNKEQQQFLNFVLQQYIKEGVDELDDAKLGDLLILNYGGSIGLDIPIYKNALQLKKDAELIANERKSYSSATSLLILSSEEAVKSILVKLHSEGYKIYLVKDSKRFFKDHKIRHQIAQLLEIGTGLMDSINFYEQEKSDTSHKHWFRKALIILSDILIAASPAIEALQHAKKLQTFNSLKNKGFYVDFQDNLFVPKMEITEKIYNETLAITNRVFSFSKSIRILHHPNAEYHADPKEIEQTKSVIKKLIDDYAGTFSFKEMDKTMNKL